MVMALTNAIKDEYGGGLEEGLEFYYTVFNRMTNFKKADYLIKLRF